MRIPVNPRVCGAGRVAAAIFSVAILTWSPAAPPIVQAQGPPDRVDVLIGFRNRPGQAEEAIVRGNGGDIKYTFDIVPAIAASVPVTALFGLEHNPRVTVVEPDAEVFALDTELDNTWGVKKTGGGVSSTDGGGIKIAVIDSGVDCSHPELMRGGVTICGAGWDFVNNDANPADDNGHGTHVAGTIAAAKDTVGVVGMAPRVTIYPLKVLNASGSGSFSSMMAALQWAQKNGIQITSNSYGSTTDPGTIIKSAYDNTATTILHIAAAGNSGTCTGSTDTVNYPAKYASVVAVAATNSSSTRPCWSSTGPKVELAAPGESIKSTVPGGKYATYSGTSMATPHVTGAAALVKALNTALSPGQVRSILQATSIDLGSAGRDTSFGYGLISATSAESMAKLGTIPYTPKLSVPTITYALSSGNVVMTVKVLNEYGGTVTGAKVTVKITKDGVTYSTPSGVTGSSGQVTFQLTALPSGTYKGSITGVTLTGWAWNGVQPTTNAGIKK